MLLRDPVERYISGLGLLQRSGALKGQVGAGELGAREHRIVEAMDRGRYAAQLAWWLRHFPREQVLLLQYERCVADTQGQLSRTFEFLGLPDQRASVAEVSRTRKKATEHAAAGAGAARLARRVLRGRRGRPADAHARPRPGALEGLRDTGAAVRLSRGDRPMAKSRRIARPSALTCRGASPVPGRRLAGFR